MNGLFRLRAGGAIDSGGNHITEKTQGLAESSNENVFPLCVFLRYDSISDLSLTRAQHAFTYTSQTIEYQKQLDIVV